jgi:hypothetical protein
MAIIEILSFVEMHLIYELGKDYGNLKYHDYMVCLDKRMPTWMSISYGVIILHVRLLVKQFDNIHELESTNIGQ